METRHITQVKILYANNNTIIGLEYIYKGEVVTIKGSISTTPDIKKLYSLANRKNSRFTQSEADTNMYVLKKAKQKTVTEKQKKSEQLRQRLNKLPLNITDVSQLLAHDPYRIREADARDILPQKYWAQIESLCIAVEGWMQEVATGIPSIASLMVRLDAYRVLYYIEMNLTAKIYIYVTDTDTKPPKEITGARHYTDLHKALTHVVTELDKIHKPTTKPKTKL